ncbi:uncharacterized protein GIQ15_03067 [Arthroderma uncinatum]|uniref:uncharacterized protein n=1 Tax=Arthroderma uncinatum TaxID=74035 RepID=UPI00144A8E8C|nr:uncharacterized protein GIQ15_03067 [Arthroderma uncinatum]KAF3483743.1 hypothetical protein GIQ15_03067 [Arthroderma uncinatum]
MPSMNSRRSIASTVFKALATDSRPWHLTRKLRSDNHLDMQGELKGIATFKPAHYGTSDDASDLVYEERGEMPDPSGRNMAVMSWSRKYLWRLSDSNLSVWFVKVNTKAEKETQNGQTEDLPDYLFHQLRFTSEGEGEALSEDSSAISDLVPPPAASGEETTVLFASGSHLCINDNYETTYAFRITEHGTNRVHSWTSSHLVQGPKKNQRIVNLYTRTTQA